MSIIIAYASAGAGHLKAAEAIFRHLKDKHPDLNVKLVDVLDETLPLFSLFYSWGYSLMVRHLVTIWRLVYFLTDFKLLRKLMKALTEITHRMNTRSFASFLVAEQPKIIISTHFLPSEIASYLKEKRKINSKLITVITDFSVHNYWITDYTDLYIVASDAAKKRLMKARVPMEAIKEFGIPISEKFLKPLDRRKIREKLGLDAKQLTVLIMTGSFGFGPLERISEAIHKDAQVIVVCAANKKLFNRLKRRKLTNVREFSLVDNMEELMVASDLIITKPGGLTIAEVLISRLPPIFISAIPGHEEHNVKALAGYGIGLAPKSVRAIKAIVSDFKQHPEKLIAMKANMEKLRKPNCLEDICNVVR